MALALAAERDCAAGDIAAWSIANFLVISISLFPIVILIEYAVKSIFLKKGLCVLSFNFR